MEKAALDDADEGMPVRVPEAIAAAVVDSLVEAAMPAMLVATGLAVDVDVGELVVNPDVVLDVTS